MPIRSGNECHVWISLWIFCEAFIGSYEEKVKVTEQNLGYWRSKDRDITTLENVATMWTQAKRGHICYREKKWSSRTSSNQKMPPKCSRQTWCWNVWCLHYWILRFPWSSLFFYYFSFWSENGYFEVLYIQNMWINFQFYRCLYLRELFEIQKGL